MPRILAFLLALLICSAAHAEGQFRVDRDTVFYEDTETGEKLWTMRHLGMDLDRENQPVYPIQGPIEFEGRWYYSVAADLLEVDVSERAIVGRTHYSLYIRDLRLNEGKLEVVVDPDDPLDPERRIALVHTGESPGRGFWQEGPLTAMRALKDTTAYLKDKDWENSAEDRASVVGHLLAAANLDHTNPFYLGYLGLFAHLDQKPEKASGYFRQALETQTPWFDMVRLCGILRRAESDELAKNACDRALEGMKSQRIRPEAMYSLITFATMMQHHREAMKAAVEAADHSRVDAIAEDIYRLFPTVEASHQSWRILSDWFEEAGKPELAGKWSSRSAVIEAAPATQAFWGGARKVDRLLVVLVGGTLMLPLAGFFIGLRTRRRKPDAEGFAKWLPRPSVLEVLSIVLVLIAVVFAGHSAAKNITMIGEFASMPTPLMSEGYGSPESIRWIDGRVESPARDELLTYAREELEAARSGVQGESEPPAEDLLIHVVDRHANTTVWHDFFKSGSFKIFERASFGTSSTPNPPVGLPVLIIFLFFLFVGAAVSRVIGDASRWPGYFVPGGTLNAGWATPWIMSSFIAGALWAFTPLGSILQEIAAPAFPKFFGLEGLADSEFMLTSGLGTWLPWVMLSGAIIAHCTLIFFDRKAENSGS